MNNTRDLSSLDFTVFGERVNSAISTRIVTAPREHTRFDSMRAGHIIKLIVGLVQHYGALTLNEIDALLYCLDINERIDRVENFLLCAEFYEWITKDKRGLETYYSALAEKEALQYKFKDGFQILDRTRWRASIVEMWKDAEPDRFSSIQAARRKMRRRARSSGHSPWPLG